MTDNVLTSDAVRVNPLADAVLDRLVTSEKVVAGVMRDLERLTDEPDRFEWNPADNQEVR